MQKIITHIYMCLCLFFFGCNEDTEDSITVDDLKLNQIQVIGSHNSYRINATPEMHGLIASFQPEFSLDLDYGHPPLDIQFSEYGIRQIEIDIYHDSNKQRLHLVDNYIKRNYTPFEKYKHWEIYKIK